MGTTANSARMLHVLSNQTVQEMWKAFRDQVEPHCLHQNSEVSKGNTAFGGCPTASALGSGASQSLNRHPAEHWRRRWKGREHSTSSYMQKWASVAWPSGEIFCRKQFLKLFEEKGICMEPVYWCYLFQKELSRSTF